VISGGIGVPPKEEVRPGVWSIPLPLPGPLEYVVVYALVAKGDVLLVDAGWNSEAQYEVLRRTLEDIGASISAIRGIVLTHTHPDHAGMAARLRTESSALIHSHAPGDAASATSRDCVHRGLIDWGLHGSELADIMKALDQLRTRPPLAPPDVLLREADVVAPETWHLGVTHTPGHSHDHVCFIDDRNRIVFTGDHILSATTPNISLGPGAHGDPLGDYIASLRKMIDLGDFEALPGHEDRVPVVKRAQDLLAHHEEQLSLVFACVMTGCRTVRDIAEAIPWSRPWASFDVLDVFLALAETNAHLARLERAFMLSRDRSDPSTWSLKA